jgi:diguanylate cyclase (GGDEF)-like protein
MWAQTFDPSGEGTTLPGDPDLILVFGATCALTASPLLATLRSRFPGAIQLGCSTGSAVSGTTLFDEGASALAVGFDSTRISLHTRPIAATGASREAGRALAAELAAPDLAGVLVFSVGLGVNGSELVAGMQEMLDPAIPLSGGLAGDGARFEATVLAINGEAAGSTVAALALYGDAIRISHGCMGGWDEFGPRRTITASQGNVLHSLDGKPALTLYESYLGDEAAELPASGLLYPLRIWDPANPDNTFVRTLLAIDRENSALIFAGDVPAGWSAQLIHGRPPGRRGDASPLGSAATVPVRQLRRPAPADGPAHRGGDRGGDGGGRRGHADLGLLFLWRDRPAARRRAGRAAQPDRHAHLPGRGRLTMAGELHPLLRRQLAKSGGAPAGSEPLLERISAAYADFDRDRARNNHANAMMAEELERTLDEFRLQNLRFRAALDSMEQGLCLFDKGEAVAVCNRFFLRLYGFAEDADLLGLSLPDLLARAPVLADLPDMDRRLLVVEHLACGSGQSVELAWPGNRTITLNRSATADGGFLLTVSDITAAIQASARIAYLARHDPLTDLPNRVQLRERLAEMVRNGRPGERCAVICLDLDRFKIVNDTHGHQVGDDLLVAVTRRLKNLLRPQDTIARLGGDEFAIVLQHVRRQSHVERLAERITVELAKVFAIKGLRISIGASLGIAMETVTELNPAEAMMRADIALYAAKSRGRGGWRVYTPEMHELTRVRLQLETDLRKALERNEFIVHYQPQMDLASRSLTTVEALVRWNSPERGMVMPADFIPACEEIGLIEDLGRIVLETATKDACTWPAGTMVAVNLSPAQFQSGQLVDNVKRALANSGLPADRLELEVTENLMIEDTASVLGQIQALKRIGCRISLDDFGIGYSSLSYIRQFPFDKIKIDKTFVRDIEHNADSLAIIRAVASLCESLALTSAAEGVETMEQLELLHSKNIDCVQGFLICCPMASAQVSEFIVASGASGGRFRRQDAA